MHFWIFQTGEPLPIDKGSHRPMRAINLSTSLLKKGHKVTLFSALFNHQQKTFRGKGLKQKIISNKFKIILLSSTGYKKNLGLKRLVDHFVLAFNLGIFITIRKLEKPDIVFIGYPPIETAFILSLWSKLKQIPYILDIKDQWPHIFHRVIPNRISLLGKIIIAPYYILFNYSVSRAESITSTSQEFINWTYKNSSRINSAKDIPLYLTSKPQELDEAQVNNSISFWKKNGLDLDNNSIFCFIGTLSNSFDFLELSKATKMLDIENYDYKLVICGDGTYYEYTRKLFKNSTNVKLMGWIDKTKASVLLSKSKAMVAPYIKSEDFECSIPNKILDSLALGIPILTTLEGEVKNKILNVGAGLNCTSRVEWYKNMIKIITSNDYQKIMSEKALGLYKTKYEFEMVYNTYIDHLENIVK